MSWIPWKKFHLSLHTAHDRAEENPGGATLKHKNIIVYRNPHLWI